MRIKIYIVAVLVVLLGAGNVFSQDFLGHRDNFKVVNWKFYEGDIHSAESGDKISEQGWEDVTIPHTWNAKDVLTEGDHCYQGVGWYRSSFDLPPKQKGGRYFIRFEGVCLVADVYVNGVYIGRHKGGYSAFCYEITRQVRSSRKNSISVKADNSMQADVAPSGTYLYPLFGGIYRPVTVFSTNDICISPLDYASSGVYIRPVNVSAKQAEIEVVTLLDYDTASKGRNDAEVTLKATVLDNNNVIAQSRKKVVVKNNRQTRGVSKIQIDNPHLWNAKKDPYLYKLNVCVEDPQGVKIDELDQPMGLRFFEVDRDKGLILNGQLYHLHGVCRHQEWEGLGSALTDEHHKRDIELILELGANGVRLAHYQQADKMYSLCDEKGLVVWAEIPNTPAYRAENPAYVQNCRDQLTELIKQNYNHPSILFWGLYNEIPISAEDVKSLHQTAKQLDPYRLTTQADYTQPTARHFETDVAAWNWYFGWYYDSFDKYSSWYNNLHKQYPRLKGGLSEYGAEGCISQQQENPRRPDPLGRFFPEQYQRLYHEQVWKNIKDRDDIWCKFVWNMFDFSWTFANRGDRPYMNHKGLVTHDRKVKKDAFYFYKANWSDEPVLYIASRRNTQRTEELVEVAVYTNLDEVELYVNEKLISSKKMDSDIHKIVWKDVVLRPGRNQINV
ncbi:MAG: glycoside hydrolase family 2 protein, partial [Sedimentisphaerales bacterium]|nr:glycoside hydrolase family 2 protein [Sedimentisphaerales bacterium]